MTTTADPEPAGTAAVPKESLLSSNRQQQREQQQHHKYRMVALDLDGTLLNSKHKLSEATKKYLRYLDQRGFTIIIATGRAISTVYETIASLNLPKALPVVCSNGAEGLLCSVLATAGGGGGTTVVVDLEKKQRLFYTPVPAVVARRTLSLSKEMGFVTQYYVGDTIYADPTTKEHLELTNRYMELTGSKTIYVEDDFQEAMKLGLPSKQLVLCSNADQDRMMEAFEAEFSKPEYQLVDNNNNNTNKMTTMVRGNLGWFMEVLHPDVNKGHGLQQMCEQLKIPLEDCIAFGDGDNDYEFLQMAGKGFAMANARDIVKTVADEVLDCTNDGDGVIRTLKVMEAQGSLQFSPW